MRIMYCIGSMVTRAGMETILYAKACELVERYGDQVIIVTTDESKGTFCFERHEGIRLIDLKLNYYTTFDRPASAKKYLELAQKLNAHKIRLGQVIRKVRPDVIISLGDCDEWVLPYVHGDIPIVDECHFHKTYRMEREATVYEKVRAFFNEKLKLKYNAFVTLTEKDKDAWGLPNCLCIPNFSIFESSGRRADPTSHRVIAVGRLDEQKGFDRLLDIWEKVTNSSSYDASWKLYIFGEGTDHGKLQNQIEENGISDSAFLMGSTNHLLDEYCASSIQVMTSRFEGFPLTLIEGMSCGLVPIAYDCKQGPSEIITEDAGCLIEEGDEKAFVRALLHLMEDEEERRIRSGQALVRSRAFSRNTIMPRWRELFLRLTQGGSFFDKYQIVETIGEQNNAGSKATADVTEIASECGYQSLSIQIAPPDESMLHKLTKQFGYADAWLKIEREIPDNAIVLLQHPFHYREWGRGECLHRLKREKGVRFISLVHDVEELRKYRYNRYYEREFNEMLDIADVLIVHNEKMKEFFVSRGVDKERIVCLSIFDYLLRDQNENELPADDSYRALTIAGNLDAEKSAYLQQLSGLENLTVHLYGPNYDGTKTMGEHILYHGVVPADDLPRKLTTGFGLVWDGSRTDTCAGDAGEYLRYNNPHKLSLYLASGIPVIIWKYAAEADFVTSHRLGFAVAGLKEAEEKILSCSREEYVQMLHSVERLRNELIHGEYTRSALAEAEARIHS